MMSCYLQIKLQINREDMGGENYIHCVSLVLALSGNLTVVKPTSLMGQDTLPRLHHVHII